MFPADGTLISASAVPHCGVVCSDDLQMEDLGQANVDVPLGVGCLPLLERGKSHTTGFGEEDCGYLILDTLNFRGRLSPVKSQD